MTQLILYNVYIMITNYISCDMNRALSKNAEKCYDEIKTTYCIYNIKYRLHNRFYYSGGWLHSMVMIKVGKMLMRNYARKKIWAILVGLSVYKFTNTIMAPSQLTN